MHSSTFAPREANASPPHHPGMMSATRVFSLILTILGILTAVVYLFNIGVGFWGKYVVGTGYLHLILAFFLPLVFIYFPARSHSHEKGIPWYDVILSVMCFVGPFYYFLHSQNIVFEGWEVEPPNIAYVLGIILWIAVLEAARRTMGMFFFLLSLFSSLYPLFAEHMPGLLFARSFDFSRLVGYYIMGPEGVIGLPTKVLAELFIGFMLFGVALSATGGAKFFLDVALSVFGTVRGGTAKTAVVASSLVGMVSGSAVSNVLVVGTTTIPAMIKSGFPKSYAAGIETCSSTGGVVMPPVMGAAAFIMAGLLNIPYARVALAAVIPSLLYYLGLFVQVDCYAAKMGLKGIPREELPTFRQAMKEGFLYIVAFVILMYTLFFLRREPQAPFLATLALLAAAQIRMKSRLNLKGFLKFIEDSGKTLAEITGILACIGPMVGAILITGIAQTLTNDLITLAGGNIVWMVILGAVTSFILGMPLTATACYILLAVLLAPALVQSGLNILAVHMFIFYCGVLSFITPPVAIPAYAAAAIAQTDPMKTGWVAMRLGVILFIIPFFFIFDPSFVLSGSMIGILKAATTGTVGVILIASGLEGYLVFAGRLGLFKRILSIISGLLIFTPIGLLQLIGIIPAAFLLGGRLLRSNQPASVEGK